MELTRRALLKHLSFAGAACALGLPKPAGAAITGHEADWQWLVGNWDVHHERLRDRLVGSTTWDEFGGRTSMWLTLGGLGTIDDCLLYLPAGTYRAIAPRAFDPVSGQWNIWWLDGRMAGKLDPPVRGVFTGSEGEFRGHDAHKGTPVTVRFRWHETNGKRPWWDQSFSTDGGRNWEINWRNYFTRTNAVPAPVALDAGEKTPEQAGDWAFLAGQWKVQNRRLKDGRWETFPSTLHNRPVMGGLGNVGDNVFETPQGTYRGMSMRAFDADGGVWRSWWLDGRTPQDIGAPVAGKFDKGAGTLIGEDVVNGEKVQVRSRWSGVTAKSAHWEQAISRDGRNWQANWVADLERAPG